MSDLVDFVYQDLLYGLNELTAFQPQTIEDLYDAYFLLDILFREFGRLLHFVENAMSSNEDWRQVDVHKKVRNRLKKISQHLGSNSHSFKIMRRSVTFYH